MNYLIAFYISKILFYYFDKMLLDIILSIEKRDT